MYMPGSQINRSIPFFPAEVIEYTGDGTFLMPSLRSSCPASEPLAEQLAAMHLQWFAAEDEGRTEDPTEHKIRKAREEGKVAKSPDVAAAVVLLVSVITLGIIGRFFFNNMSNMLGFFLRNSTEIDITTDKGLFTAFLQYFVRLTVPIGLVAFAGALIGNIVQVGFLFTAKPITPDFNKIVPHFGKFFKRALFSTEALFNLAKSIFKVVLIAILAFLNIRAEIEKIANLVNTTFLKSLSIIAGIAFNILIQAAIVLLILSIADYIFQKRQHTESLKMTKQEVKEERKQYEGDPLIKQRLRQRMQDLLSRNMMQNVPRADVIVTNPTHYAVALEYKSEIMQAPMVLAKGADNIAARMREIAEENGVPMIENKPLARALYAEVEIGDYIPEKFYEAVVAVLTEVYRMTGKTKAVV